MVIDHRLNHRYLGIEVICNFVSKVKGDGAFSFYSKLRPDLDELLQEREYDQNNGQRMIVTDNSSISRNSGRRLPGRHKNRERGSTS
jgi:hypothetical protein